MRAPALSAWSERTVYGELVADAADHNLRARPYRTYDSAGAVTTEALDFAGNVLRASRRLASDPAGMADWSALKGPSTIAQIEAAADPFLDDQALTTTTEYDAFSRPTVVVTPDGSVATPAYDEAGLLAAVAIRLRGAAAATTFVAETAHNARGQRERVRIRQRRHLYLQLRREILPPRPDRVGPARRSGGAGPSLYLRPGRQRRGGGRCWRSSR